MPTSRLVALALLVGTFFVGQEALTQLALGRPVQVVNDIGVVLRFWVVWALLTPFVLKALRRWPLDAKPVAAPIVAHVAVGATLASVHSALALGVELIERSLIDSMSLRAALRQPTVPVAFTAGVFTSAVFYAMAVMVYSAVRFRMMSTSLRAELAQSKLDTLRSQLRPHFLFNALNAISVFVTEDANKAQRMLLRLSTLLRRSLDEEAHEVPLRQELAFVDDYLEIQRGRFGDQLHVQMDIAPAVLGARFPVFLLQPLLENAVEHGRAEAEYTAIALSAKREDGQLRVTVEDNGPGLRNGSTVREGIGLRNTRARLHHLYGGAASVHLQAASGSSDPRGTRVEIRIPFSEALR